MKKKNSFLLDAVTFVIFMRCIAVSVNTIQVNLFPVSVALGCIRCVSLPFTTYFLCIYTVKYIIGTSCNKYQESSSCSYFVKKF